MHKYVFELGRKWKLSAAELMSVFGDSDIEVNSEVLIKTLEKPLVSPQDFLDRLGGTIKIAEVFDEAGDLREAESKIVKYLENKRDGKIIFALNIFNLEGSFKNVLRKLLKNVKNGLRGGGGKVRFLNKPDQNVRSVVIFEEGLSEKGTDVSVIKNDGRFLLASTVAVQNFKKYSVRDYERPARDVKSGMLPPKLAQIMINLACGDREKCTIYDPFCGSGTILMEGVLMGHQVIGSDISEKAVLDSQKNLEWFGGRFDVDLDLVKDVFVKDATKLDTGDLKVEPDCIVTETYLGPPLLKFPSKEEMTENFIEIEEIVIVSLRQLTKILKKGSFVVLAVPFYRDNERNYFLEKFNKNLISLGYNNDMPFEETTKRGSLLYFRKDQIVGREIFKLKLS